MSTRVQVIVGQQERERFRRCAERQGQSLSAWIRDAARERAGEEPAERLETAAQVRDFFAECDRRETEGREPDWHEHRQVIEESIRAGSPTT